MSLSFLCTYFDIGRFKLMSSHPPHLELISSNYDHHIFNMISISFITIMKGGIIGRGGDYPFEKVKGHFYFWRKDWGENTPLPPNHFL